MAEIAMRPGKVRDWKQARVRFKALRDKNFAEWWAEEAPKVRGFRSDDRMKELCREAWDEGIEWAQWSPEESEAYTEWAENLGWGIEAGLGCDGWFLSKYEGPTPKLVKAAFFEATA